MPVLSPTAARLALVVEMHLLLGPISAIVLIALTPVVVMGFPHALGLLASPIREGDVPTLILMSAVPPALFALGFFWSLGAVTAQRRIHAFGWSFWFALPCSAYATAAVAFVAEPIALASVLPAWLFLYHMMLLQGRIRAAVRHAMGIRG